MIRPADVIAVLALALLCVGVVMVTSADMRVVSSIADAPLGPGQVDQSHTPTATSAGSLAATSAASTAATPTATSVSAPARHESIAGMLTKIASSSQIMYFALSIAAMLIASFMPIKKLLALAQLDPARAPRDTGTKESNAADTQTNETTHMQLPWHRAACASLWSFIKPALHGALKLDFIVLACTVLLLCAVLLGVYIPGLASPRNGSHRWILLPGMGGQTFQPSEIAKWSVVLMLAWYCARRARELRSFIRGLGPVLLALGLIIAIIGKEDLGTAALIAVVSGVVLIAAGAKVTHFLAFSPVMIGGAFAAIWIAPYRIRRLISFLEPYNDPMGDGYHIVQSLLAISGGEGTGRGLGYGLQKLGYLPEDRTDFLFSVICEELGIGGGLVVVILLGALVWTALGIARAQHIPALKLVALGIASTIAFQTLINLFVVTGLAPTKGIALPLISFGGTGWIMTSASLGLLMAIDRHSRLHADAPVPVLQSTTAQHRTPQRGLAI